MQTTLISNRDAEPTRGGAMPGGLAAALYGATNKNGAWWVGASGKHPKDNSTGEIADPHQGYRPRQAGDRRFSDDALSQFL